MESVYDTSAWVKIKRIVSDFLKNPKKLIPAFVMAGIWVIFSIMSAAGLNLPVFRFLYALTYANGGMFGGLFGAIGGIFGKAVFAACVSALVSFFTGKDDPTKGFATTMKSVFKGGFDAVVPMVFGGGLGVLAYWFFNITSSPVNCAVAVAGAVISLMEIMKKKGLIFSAFFTLIRKLSNGIAPSRLQVRRALTGFAMGFAVALPLTFIRSGLVLFLTGLVLTGASVIYIIKKRDPHKAVAISVLFMLVFMSIVPVSAGEYFPDDDELLPYRGRLTYTNGAVNKYGQPFPDLMDFDRDGELTWYDLSVQKELSHDPDLLDRPEHTAVGIIEGVLIGILGAGMGAVGGALGAGAASLGEIVGDMTADSLADAMGESAIDEIAESLSEDHDITASNPFITRDKDGDLIVKDPVTGKEHIYTAMGDGIYTNVDLGGISTEADMIDYVNRRIENYDQYMQDEAVRKAAVGAQRAANQELSQYAKDAAAEKAAMNAQWEMEDKQRAYIDKLKAQYGYAGDDTLRSKLADDQMKAEIEGYEQKELEGEYKKSQEYCETVEKVADTSIDVLAEVTGDQGKAIKDAYAFTKATMVKGSEAYAEGRNVAEGLVQGALEGGINVVQNHADSPTEKLVANVAGDAFKAGLDSTVKGEKNGLTNMVEAAGKAAFNTGIDVGFDMAGAVAKELAGGDSVVKTILGSDITADAAIDATKTLADDLTKMGAESAFTTDSDT